MTELELKIQRLRQFADKLESGEWKVKKFRFSQELKEVEPVNNAKAFEKSGEKRMEVVVYE